MSEFKSWLKNEGFFGDMFKKGKDAFLNLPHKSTTTQTILNHPKVRSHIDNLSNKLGMGGVDWDKTIKPIQAEQVPTTPQEEYERIKKNIEDLVHIRLGSMATNEPILLKKINDSISVIAKQITLKTMKPEYTGEFGRIFGYNTFNILENIHKSKMIKTEWKERFCKGLVSFIKTGIMLPIGFQISDEDANQLSVWNNKWHEHLKSITTPKPTPSPSPSPPGPGPNLNMYYDVAKETEKVIDDEIGWGQVVKPVDVMRMFNHTRKSALAKGHRLTGDDHDDLEDLIKRLIADKKIKY